MAAGQPTKVVVVQTAPQVQQTVVRHQTDDILGGIGKSFNSIGKVFDSAAKDIDRTVTKAMSGSALELLRERNIIQITSKVGGKNLRIVERGVVDCLGDASGTCSQFEVVVPRPGVVKLRSVSMPQCYLAINNGYVIGYGQGGADCDFVPSLVVGNFVTFESAAFPGNVLGALPSGLISAPAQTPKTCDAAHFIIKFVKTASR